MKKVRSPVTHQLHEDTVASAVIHTLPWGLQNSLQNSSSNLCQADVAPNQAQIERCDRTRIRLVKPERIFCLSETAVATSKKFDFMGSKNFRGPELFHTRSANATGLTSISLEVSHLIVFCSFLHVNSLKLSMRLDRRRKLNWPYVPRNTV